ncbi:exonuclease SbcCD subunit D C-terminal domain-containing protein [Bacteroides sp. 519]|uniref:exonuclease SbcCD subunit D n=1 Tax=Bacteroides sp. 519 TaxID=2302937 RepID=UPI0013D2FC83|nr:exonuclease SbcCD subunit D C-terminal domain-containing protein [Bacteroides sp. 519]NDV60755.1 exonuclease subunit SbcD [Bacteroides sp. 519]
MILLHTSDWHIGQYFYGYDRKEEHIAFFRWLKETIKQQAVDVLLIAGDIFDSPNPSAESQRIYYRFLREVTTENPALQIVITAGNHDSAARLEAANPLLQDMNISVKGVIRKNENNETDCSCLFVPLIKNGKTEAWCMAVPYLRQGDYPNTESYAHGVKEMYEQLYNEMNEVKQPGQPLIVMGHLQVMGSELSSNDRSERTIIGGLESVSTDLFDREDVLYTALGHLHKAQRMGSKQNICYSGSPLPMSFTEKKYQQGVNIIEIQDGQLTQMERVNFDPPVRLLSLPDEPRILVEVLEEIANLPDGDIVAASPYLELKVLITEPEPSMRNQIEEALQNKSVRLTSAVPFRLKREGDLQTFTYEELKTINPMKMAEDIFASRYGNEMPNKMKTLLQSVIEEAQR